MTSIDGYQMALQGRAGVALGIAAIGSFIAGTLGTLGLMLLAPPLAQRRARLRAAGIFRAGAARPHGARRGRRLGAEGAADGRRRPAARHHRHRSADRRAALRFRPGLAARRRRVHRPDGGAVRRRRGAGQLHDRRRPVRSSKSATCCPTARNGGQPRMPILRGSGIGFLIGVLPATGATIASFVAYIVEKKVAKDPSRFGTRRHRGRRRPRSRPTTPPPPARWCRCSRSACRAPAPPRSCSARSIMFGLRPGPEMFDNECRAWSGR